ncbi:CBS domain-containing protein [Candidatus Roizmanbacteria bacterium]|nr:CBS domain-containing protein [Candidatus Roizmanbacteria bacterium]
MRHKIIISYSLSKVASLFIESKVHYLPVFDQREKFLGIISARHLLSQFRDSDFFKTSIRELLKRKNRPIITAFEDDTVNTAVNTFRTTKVSKLVIIGKDLKLKGVLSHYDLISYLVSPKHSEHRGDRVGSTVNFYHLKIKNFYKTYALTLTPDHAMSEALELILDRKIGSVIIVDKTRHPIGIVTTKDFLKLLIRGETERKMQLIGKNLSEQSRHIVGGFFNYLYRSVSKIPNIVGARLFVKEEKRGGLFKVVLALIPRKGAPQVIKQEGKNLLKVLRKVKKD